ncbi:hypothetical protein OG601_46900 [Streptomyces sp. NBC_01239]|uniref:hypothetical protein n=1 Tax=Streptomyces sp. NBC_01239 TaxID=2903792 RepID=UPI0022597DAA|nr:hypothetical protein [Streptomyces sp. NBC_01239]MCX4809080.1 hypothetical protein [Streptomyces sp. NBC_01239]MCX4818103.1 hypothetical protein [Streptomyces sp. NBC_01239]
MRRHRVDHFAVAAVCRATPGVWQRVGEYNSTMSAEGAGDYICKAYTKQASQRSAYSPAGSFETRHTLTEFGALVEARYVGVGGDAAWADAVAALAEAVAS